jgi:hypothetical protein
MDKLDPATTCFRCVNGCVEIAASGQFVPALGRAAGEFDDWGIGAWPREMSALLNFQRSGVVGDCVWSEIVSGVPADVISLAEVELTP